MKLWNTNKQKRTFVAVNSGENAVNDVFVLLSAPENGSGPARPHLHFHTFLHPQEKSICLSGQREIYTLLFGNDAQTAAAQPADGFYAFSCKDKCKFTLKKEAIFTETLQRPVFLLRLITVFTRVSRSNQSAGITAANRKQRRGRFHTSKASGPLCSSVRPDGTRGPPSPELQFNWNGQGLAWENMGANMG